MKGRKIKQICKGWNYGIRESIYTTYPGAVYGFCIRQILGTLLAGFTPGSIIMCLSALSKNALILFSFVFGKLQEEFCKENAYFDIRGAQMGASFIAWLLSGTNVNPLPAHYYCPVCKKVEFHSEEKCGIDLPDKVCTCGNNNHKDGFGIDAFNMYPFFRWNEIYVSRNGTGLVQKCLQEYFNGYGEVRELRIDYDEAIEVHTSEQIRVTKFAEIEKLLLECEIPEWYVESMKKILYLFPKTHLIVLLKRDICKFIKMNN